MLKIQWRRGPDLPQGFQDSDGGFIGRHLISVGGFCSGGLEMDNQRKPGRYPRGFLDKAWALDTSQRDARWESLPRFPGEARQGLFAVAIDDAIYLWGGFSYTQPFCYANGFRLSRPSGRWKWDALPALPYPLTSAAMCAIDKRIYLLGGADYDGTIGFYTQSDRTGQISRLGARLWVLDTRTLTRSRNQRTNPDRLARIAPASGHAALRARGRGGGRQAVCDRRSDGHSQGRKNQPRLLHRRRQLDVRPARSAWTRLRDLPVSSGNFPHSTNLVFRDRYVVLPGGHQYDWVANPDGTVRPKYGEASSVRKASGLFNDCFVYDTQSGLFGSADRLPIDNNLPMAVVRGDEIYLLGGETGGGEIDGVWYGHHPDLLLIGKISQISPR